MIRFTDVVPDPELKKKAAAPASDPKPPAPAAAGTPKPTKAPRKPKTAA